jgi:hypothetical protein
MSALTNVQVSYATNTITFYLDSGEVGTIVFNIPNVGTDSESTAASNLRIERMIDGLIHANLRYLKSLASLTDLP